ncbi:glycosyltransferase [Dactylosporangium roseum]|uniref:glycosyltransferase n=1 Tax=Dactylosporangium roseum TaxID=47989 RepID=UPI0021B4BD69|nr:glycosyltransferase [Dactylosporangium roseum]
MTWEDHERTTACVQSMPSNAEIIVVDNGSRPEVSDALRAMCAATEARYIRSEENLGYSKGMNLGVRHSTRSNVILANNDVVAMDGAVTMLVDALRDPKIGAAFPSVRNSDGSEGTDAGRFLSVRVGLGHATGLGVLFERLRINTTPDKADWLSGPFVAIRRETLDAIGGVDESAFFYSEDLRLCWAVRQLGLDLAFVREAVIVHENDTTSKRVWSREEISRRQTREFIRASRVQGGRRGKVATTAYAAGTVVRAAVARTSVRKAIAQGAIEGLRTP